MYHGSNVLAKPIEKWKIHKVEAKVGKSKGHGQSHLSSCADDRLWLD